MSGREYTGEQVSAALNRAADDILEAIEYSETGKRDVANLVVNAGVHYLSHPEATLDEAIIANYDGVDPAEVIDWCNE